MYNVPFGFIALFHILFLPWSLHTVPLKNKVDCCCLNNTCPGITPDCGSEVRALSLPKHSLSKSITSSDCLTRRLGNYFAPLFVNHVTLNLLRSSDWFI